VTTGQLRTKIMFSVHLVQTLSTICHQNTRIHFGNETHRQMDRYEPPVISSFYASNTKSTQKTLQDDSFLG
jgi:hypothetical protein